LEQVEYFENEILAADGSRRMLAWHSAYLKGPDGRLAGTLCAGNDVTEHKQLEQALQRSNDEMCRAQAIAQVGNWWLDLGSQRLSWSDEIHRIFGVEKGSHLTYNIFLERVHPDARWREALAGGAYDIEHRIVVDGEIKWLRERARLELDGQGRVVGAYGTTQDITLGKLTALALGESERLLREAQEAARIGTYTYHVDDDHWTCSAVLDDILGIGPAYPRTAQSWIMMVHPDDREAMGSYLADIVGARVASFDREYRIRRPVDGQVRWLHGYGQVDKAADGRVARMFGTIMDVTDRKEAEIALRETRERYRRLFLLNPLPMWVFDEETLRFLEVNDAAIAAYGYSRDAFLAMSILDIRLDTDLQALLDPVHRGGRWSRPMVRSGAIVARTAKSWMWRCGPSPSIMRADAPGW
jgi:PAS domain S-box-containing protein